MNASSVWSALDQAGFATLRLLASLLWQSSIVLGATCLLGLDGYTG